MAHYFTVVVSIIAYDEFAFASLESIDGGWHDLFKVDYHFYFV